MARNEDKLRTATRRTTLGDKPRADLNLIRSALT
jgi:hypothetical protein